VSLVKQYASKGVSAIRLLKWSELQPSSYYYKPSGGAKGMKPSTHTVKDGGELFENTVVVQQIESVFLYQEFCCYGYRNMTSELQELGWIINHKKVYRLMKLHKLLYGGKIRPEPFKRNFIR
jgi:putative transposase